MAETTPTETDTTEAAAPAEEYNSVGWWKDAEGNTHHGSTQSLGYLKATEKGTGPVPEPEPEPAAPQDSDEAAALAESERLAAEKAEAERVAADKAKADADAARQNRRAGRTQPVTEPSTES